MWEKFNELAPILTRKGISEKPQGKFYSACVLSVLVYGSKTWATKKDDRNRFRTTK